MAHAGSCPWAMTRLKVRSQGNTNVEIGSQIACRSMAADKSGHMSNDEMPTSVGRTPGAPTSAHVSMMTSSTKA